MTGAPPVPEALHAGEDPLWRLVCRLEEHGCRGRGANWRCPAHEDRNPSLRIARGRDDRVLLRCLAGCTTEAVLEALGLSWKDLFPPELRIEGARPRPDVGRLEWLYREGELRPERTDLGPLPDRAPEGVSLEDMGRIAADMALLFSLHRAVGERRPMPYGTRFAAKRMGWSNGHMRAHAVIRALVRSGVVDKLESCPRSAETSAGRPSSSRR